MVGDMQEHQLSMLLCRREQLARFLLQWCSVPFGLWLFRRRLELRAFPAMEPDLRVGHVQQGDRRSRRLSSD